LRISDRYSGAGNGGAIGRLIAATDPMSDRFAGSESLSSVPRMGCVRFRRALFHQGNLTELIELFGRLFR
jgi:hypothetical protein